MHWCWISSLCLTLYLKQTLLKLALTTTIPFHNKNGINCPTDYKFVFLFLDPSDPRNTNQDSGKFDCMQNISSIPKTSPVGNEWREGTSEPSHPRLAPVCPVPLSGSCDSPVTSYRSPFSKTNCRFSVMSSYSSHTCHQGVYHGSGNQEQPGIQHPYAVGHQFTAHAPEYAPPFYRYKPELYANNFFKGTEYLGNGHMALPIASHTGSLDASLQGYSS